MTIYDILANLNEMVKENENEFDDEELFCAHLIVTSSTSQTLICIPSDKDVLKLTSIMGDQIKGCLTDQQKPMVRLAQIGLRTVGHSVQATNEAEYKRLRAILKLAASGENKSNDEPEH